MTNLAVKIGKLVLKNPVILASGTAGFGKEIKDFIDINKLGAIVTKTVTLNKRKGNPPPRVLETPGGLLNSIGLANDGLKDFMFKKIPFLEKLKIPVVVSIAGDTIDEFVILAKELSKAGCVRAIEVNLSCPNVEKTGAEIGQDPHLVAEIGEAVKSRVNKPVFVNILKK